MLLLSVSHAFAEDDTQAPTIIHHTEEQEYPLQQSIEVIAEIRDNSGIFEPRVYYRLVGSKDYSSVDMVLKNDKHVGAIPGYIVTGSIEYYIEAFDVNGNGPAREGSPETPHILKVSQSASSNPIAITKPIYREYWFWGVIGAAALTGGIVWFASSGKEAPQSVNLEIIVPSIDQLLSQSSP